MLWGAFVLSRVGSLLLRPAVLHVAPERKYQTFATFSRRSPKGDGLTLDVQHFKQYILRSEFELFMYFCKRLSVASLLHFI